MITTGALIHGDRQALLRYSSAEHPVALQLGGSDPKALALCSRMVADAGYDEVNLNVGCPSNRVQNGRFGACLMAEPDRVAECVSAMQSAVLLPVTVKTRIGIDDRDSFEHLCDFVQRVADGGCQTFIIHARKAWLNGLSPKQNRTIPPLQYETVFRLKQSFPALTIILNGGISDAECGRHFCDRVDGIMMGREAYQNPYRLASVDHLFYEEGSQPPSRFDVLDRYYDYMQQELDRGTPLKHMTRHILGLFHQQPGAKIWRRTISELAHKPNSTVDVVKQATAAMLTYWRDDETSDREEQINRA